VVLHDGPVLRAAWWEKPISASEQGGSQNASAAMNGGIPGQQLQENYVPGGDAGQRGFQPMPGQPGGYAPQPAGGAPMQAAGGYPNQQMTGWPSTPALSPKQKMALARDLLVQSDNNLGWVAAQLGIHPTTLYRWRKQGKV